MPDRTFRNRSLTALRRRAAAVSLLCGATLAAGCMTGNGASTGESTAMQQGATMGQWTSLFDGTDLRQWRGYRRDTAPSSWTVENGTLAFAPASDRGDLMTREQFGDFELELEWKVAEGANSGVIYRIGETQQYPWQTGPEMQVLDDQRHPDGQIPSHRAGALYDLVVPPANVARPVGEWNRARVRVEGNRIQHWLNGTQTADLTIGSEQWNQAMANSKFRTMPSFATVQRGHIALQDHGDRVWYRNIRIRRLGGG